MRKKLSLFLVMMTVVLLLASCSSNPVSGVWKSETGTIDFVSDEKFVSDDFFDNEENEEGTYTFSSEEKKVTIKRTNSEEVVYSYKVSATGLTLSQREDVIYDLTKSSRREGMIKMPLGILLGFTVSLVKDYAIAVILFTIFLKLILLPISINQTKSTVKMGKVSPIVKKINEKYKHDKQKAQEKTMELYKKAKVNPLAGCLPMIINMVLLISFFQVLLNPEVFIIVDGESISNSILHGSFLWIKDLSEPDLLVKLIPGLANIIPENYVNMIPGIMPILTAVVTLFSFNSLTAGQPEQANNSMMKGMKYMMPIMFLFMGARYPAALMVYWTVSSIIQMVQQPIIKKLVDKEVE